MRPLNSPGWIPAPFIGFVMPPASPTIARPGIARADRSYRYGIEPAIVCFRRGMSVPNFRQKATVAAGPALGPPAPTVPSPPLGKAPGDPPPLAPPTNRGKETR